jgi:Flp pilus assembly CpaE family ATPase
MHTVVRSIAVVDRTRVIQQALRRSGIDAWEVSATELDVELPDVDVLLVGARELTAAGRRRIDHWRQWQPAGFVVAHVNGHEVDRNLLRACGVEHVVRGRLTARKLRTAFGHADETIAGLLAAADRLHGGDREPADVVEPSYAVMGGPGDDEPHAAALAVLDESADETDETDEAPEGPVARLLTVASATGGCGKTFYATNIASLFARSGARVLLLDLDLQFGEVAAALQVQHPYSLYDGLYGTNGERLPVSAMREHLDDLVYHHPLGFDVLSAPRDPVLADFVGARDAMHLLDAALPRYDVVIADTPPSLNDVVIAALDRSDLVCVLATLDVPSLRNLTAFMDVLRRLSLDDQRLRLVLNKAEKDVGVTVEQADEAFGGRFETVLPADRAVSRSVNLGTTVAVHEPRSKISKALVPAVRSLMQELGLAGPEPAPVGARPALPSGRFGLFRRLLSGGSA